ncbi:MAG: carbamoyltransferase HypF [Gemmataceae bacterium]
MPLVESGLAAETIRMRGLVQGVGFRPFVYRLANQLHLAGWVMNDGDGVLIQIQGPPHLVEEFCGCMQSSLPSGAVLSEMIRQPGRPEPAQGFTIRPGPATTRSTTTRVPPDRVVCSACLSDMDDPQNRRYRYPMTTCTACGPRFSILHGLPYDRSRTTLHDFPLCPACAEEYDNPGDRRFHAQPIGCPKCGPHVHLDDTLDEAAITRAAAALRDGCIVALKGVGGFQLLVRADNSSAVGRLRARKRRPTKPFAVMVPSLVEADRQAELGPLSLSLLTAPEGPIVLCRQRPGSQLVAEVAPHLNLVGLMLPTTPLHHLLLSQVDFPVVATSGNLTEEPIEIDDTRARVSLASVADFFLMHNRPIAHRLDDSVLREVAGRPTLLRLARGYAPYPLVHLERWLRARGGGPTPVLALGGQQKTALALWTGSQAILGPHMGDLDHSATRDLLRHALVDLPTLYGCHPELLACDQHPDYFSRGLALEDGRPVVEVQHHHAHAVAAMIEHDLLDAEVLAFTWDGTGYGPDGSIWGGEVLRATVAGYQRVASLLPFVLPGGEAAIREPARVALALLSQALGVNALLADDSLLSWLGFNSATAARHLTLIERNLHCPSSTSMGRLFDAVAVLTLGVSQVHHEGEAATWLEAVAEDDEPAAYSLPLTPGPGLIQGDWRPLIRAVVNDRRGGVRPGQIAMRFHRALAHWIAEIAPLHPQLPVILGGGCFQNAVLGQCIDEVRTAARPWYAAGLIPPGDGGLAVGQLGVALSNRVGSNGS